MRAAVGLALLSMCSGGCSLLFAPSSYTDQREAGAQDAGVDGSHDAAGDAFAVDAFAGDAFAEDTGIVVDANVDAGPTDAGPVHPYWPSCLEDAVDARDVLGEPVDPSADLRLALGMTPRAAFGVVSDLAIPMLPTRVSLVEITSDTDGNIFVIAAPEGPGAPRIVTITRDGTFTATDVGLSSGFPASAQVLDVSAHSSSTGPVLALLVRNGSMFEVRTCALESTVPCALSTTVFTASGNTPTAIAVVDLEGAPSTMVAALSDTEPSVNVTPSGMGGVLSPGGFVMHPDSRASATGGAVVMIGRAPGVPWLVVSADGTGYASERSLPAVDAAALMATAPDDYLFVGASERAGDSMDVSFTTATCPAAGGPCTVAAVPTSVSVAGPDPIVIDGEFDATSGVGFLVVGMGYGDSEGTDVRLYAVRPTELIPVSSAADFVTLGTGRGGAAGTLSSTAMTTYFGATEIDVFEVTAAETSDMTEAVYLSAARFCRTGAP